LKSSKEECLKLQEEVDNLHFNAESHGKERRKLNQELNSLRSFTVWYPGSMGQYINLSESQTAAPYVMVLIDGDNTLVSVTRADKEGY
jgi:hypothetical protein